MTNYRLNPDLSFSGDERWPVIVRYKNLVLRPLHRRDEQEWDELRALNVAWTGPWDATLPPESAGPTLDFKTSVHNQHRRAKQGAQLPWVISWDKYWPKPIRSDMHTIIIGQLTVSNIMYGSARSASIGYWISRYEAGQGLTPLAVAMAMDYCFAVLKLHRIEIAIRPENAPSLRVPQKLGMTEEGLRRSYLHIGGDWRDHRVFAMLRDEARHGLVNQLAVD